MGGKSKEIIFDILTEHDGDRYIILICLGFFCFVCVLLDAIVGKSSAITSVFYGPYSLIQSLACYVFIRSSFVSAVEIVQARSMGTRSTPSMATASVAGGAGKSHSALPGKSHSALPGK